jgi:hypothetical protein
LAYRGSFPKGAYVTVRPLPMRLSIAIGGLGFR